MSERDDGGLPVFVFPSNIHFIADEPATHKKILTVYNPYEFPVTYKILSTSPRKYSVIEPNGNLKPRSCVDIVIRHLAASVKLDVGKVDKFRFHLQRLNEKEVNGRKDVQAVLYRTRRDIEGTSAPHQMLAAQLPPSPPSEYQQPLMTADSNHRADINGGPSLWFILAALACIGALALPLYGDKQNTSSLPDYMHLTVPQKLAVAYVLGLLTMLLIR